MKKYKIPVIPGDGIGPEMIREGKKVINKVGKLKNFKIDWIEYPFGAEYYLKTGKIITNEVLEELKSFKVMYMGALGDPKVKPGILESDLLIKMRYNLNQYINYRPVKLLKGVQSPLKNVTRNDLDIIFIRENIEDFYIGLGDRTTKSNSFKKHIVERENYKAEFDIDLTSDTREVAYNIGFITRENTEKVMEYSFKLAKKLNKKRITCVDKMNVIPDMYGLWRNIARKISKKYPNIELEFNYADAINMKLVQDPGHYDIIVCPNLFGDILTDLGAVLTGGLGLAPSANINPNGTSMFEAVHGSAPDIAGKNIANPCATILAGALMLENLGENDAAKMINKSVQKTIKKGRVLTKDLGGNSSSIEMGDEISKNL